LFTADLVNAMAGSLTIADPSSTVGATLSLVSAGAPSFIPNGTKYTVISYDGTWNGNAFANAPHLGIIYLVGIKPFQIRYNDTTPGQNFAGETALNTTGRFVTLTAVPELGSFIAMGLVACCMLGAVRVGKRFGVNLLDI
jgi:hypothetical protein